MSYPKMTLKIELVGINVANIILIQVHDIYTKNGILLQTGRCIYTPNEWMFYVGDDFSINKNSRIITIPKTPKKNEQLVFFKCEEERYKKLKELYTALLQWSGDNFFKNMPVFSKTPKIKFNNNTWIIF